MSSIRAAVKAFLTAEVNAKHLSEESIKRAEPILSRDPTTWESGEVRYLLDLVAVSDNNQNTE